MWACRQSKCLHCKAPLILMTCTRWLIGFQLVYYVSWNNASCRGSTSAVNFLFSLNFLVDCRLSFTFAVLCCLYMAWLSFTCTFCSTSWPALALHQHFCFKQIDVMPDIMRCYLWPTRFSLCHKHVSLPARFITSWGFFWFCHSTRSSAPLCLALFGGCNFATVEH